MTATPLDAFIFGLTTEAEVHHFDIKNKVTAMATEEQKINIEERAAFYRVCTRTCYRWLRAGVDLYDPKAVALHLLELKNPSPDAIEAILEALTD